MSTLILLAAILCQDPTFPDSDPAPAIAAARKKAADNNRVVLVLWGATDSEPSKAAATMLKKNKEVARLVLYEYDLVLADAAKAPEGMRKTMGTLPLPWLSFHSADGKSVGYWETPADAAEMVTLLKKQQREPLKAKDVLAAAMKKAETEKKRVLLTFGAPW
jgi:hypothetical protein